MAQLIGVVLAGGEGSKRGRSRGSLVLDGLTLAERAAQALRPLSASVLVSVPPGAANPVPKYPSVEDVPPARRGPLAGIDSVMRVTGNSDLLVLACVYPHVPTEMLKVIVGASASGADLVLPVDPAGRDHPLVAFWRRSTARRVREALENRVYKVRALLGDLEVRRLMPSDLPGLDLARILQQVEGPEDLEGPR
jgi:molybdopterin-guanine dinucleotide biosynthesis protein A